MNKRRRPKKSSTRNKQRIKKKWPSSRSSSKKNKGLNKKHYLASRKAKKKLIQMS